MLQILFQWKVALTVTIQRMLENQHRSGILSSDCSFGDEKMWSASLVVIRSKCRLGIDQLLGISPSVDAVSGINKVCMSGQIARSRT